MSSEAAEGEYYGVLDSSEKRYLWYEKTGENDEDRLLSEEEARECGFPVKAGDAFFRALKQAKIEYKAGRFRPIGEIIAELQEAEERHVEESKEADEQA